MILYATGKEIVPGSDDLADEKTPPVAGKGL
jgi:hypothetical protein